eukprot:12175285-Ditylum_brightwellii.AAC.1
MRLEHRICLPLPPGYVPADASVPSTLAHCIGVLIGICQTSQKAFLEDSEAHFRRVVTALL